MKSRTERITSRLFDAAWIIFLISQMVAISAWYALEASELKVIIYKGAAVISVGLLVAVIIVNIIKKIYSMKAAVGLGVLAVIFALVWYFSRDFMILWIWALLAAAVGQSGRRLITISTIITGAALLITVATSQLGLSVDYLFDETTRARHGLGFGWTTNAATLLFFFALGYIFLRKSHFRIWEAAIIELANVYLYIMTDTRLPFALLTAVLTFFALPGLKNHIGALAHLKVFFILLPVIVCAVTFAIYFLPDKDSSVYIWLDNLLSHRLYYGKLGVETYGITAFGQEIIWAGGSVVESSASYLYVDCSYLKILAEGGIGLLAAALAVYTQLSLRAVRAEDYWLVVIIACILIHSFTEPRLVDMAFNAFPVLLCAGLEDGEVVYKKEFLKQIFGGTH